MTCFKLFLTAALLIAVGICNLSCADTSWRSYGHDTRQFSNQPNESVLNASTVATLDFASPHGWDFTIPGGGQFTASPSVYDNTVYVGSLNGRFYAIWATGANQGTIRWQYPPTSSPPPDSCGTTTAPLLIAAGSGNPSGPGIASSAAVVDGVAGHTAVIFGAPDPNSNGGDGRLWALDAATGQCIWKSAVIAPNSGTPPIGFLSKIGYSSPAIAHGRAYVGVASKSPDDLSVGKVFAIDLATGALVPGFNFSAAGTLPGGNVWSSPSITPSGNVVVTTGNSCFHEPWVPNCAGIVPSPDYTNSILKLDWQNGNVLWQVQPVAVQHDHDPDFAASPIVGQVSCGSLAISVQKDGYVYAVDIKTGGPFSNPACSYPGHSLECPRWTFPSVASLPFQDDGHGDTDFKRQGALDGDRLFIAAGGYDLEPPPGHFVQQVYNRLHSLNVCAAEADRVRWILPNLPGNAGGVSVANGVIYLGMWTPFTSSAAHHFYAIADTDVLPPSSFVCSYPSIPAGFMCSSAGFHNVPVPVVVRDLTLTGSIQGIPAISGGRVYVATTAGHLYALGQ